MAILQPATHPKKCTVHNLKQLFAHPYFSSQELNRFEKDIQTSKNFLAEIMPILKELPN